MPTVKPARVFADDLSALAAWFLSVGVTHFSMSCDSPYLALNARTDNEACALFATLVKHGAKSRTKPHYTGNANHHWLASSLDIGEVSISLYGPHHDGGFSDQTLAEFDPPRLDIGREAES